MLIDDSVVRGTTSKKIVQMMFEAGAREVHLRISSPPITHPDFYGIDTPRTIELLAANMSVTEMREFIGATSLAFLSVDGIYRALGYEQRDRAQPAVHRPLLHRRLSDALDRSERPHHAAPAVVAGRGRLDLTSWPPPLFDAW